MPLNDVTKKLRESIEDRDRSPFRTSVELHRLAEIEARVMARYLFTLCDWQLIIAAWAYEDRDQPTMTDATYDRLCRMAADRGTSIPGFDASTGQWIHTLAQEVPGLLDRLLDDALAVNDRKRDLHAPQVRHALEKNGLKFLCCLGKNSCQKD